MFLDTKEFEKLSQPTQDNYYHMWWELEYLLGINDKPCIRCGNKPEHGEYYCEDCKKKEDHIEYMIVVQYMHDEKYHDKEKTKIRTIVNGILSHGKKYKR